MKKTCVSLLALFVASHTAMAAEQHQIWGEKNAFVPNPHPISTGLSPQNYQLKPISSTSNQQHARYQLTFKGIPVWGHQLIFHNNPGKKSLITGTSVTGIEADINNTEGKLSAEAVEKKILANTKDAIKYKVIKKVIYIDNQQQAHLAYHLSFYTNDSKLKPSAPNYIIDANDGEVLKQWNNVHQLNVGQGLGGNAFNLPYRLGGFQYGNALPGLLSLGKFDVKVSKGYCFVQNNNVKVINLENMELNEEAFPIGAQDEIRYKLDAFSYPCSPQSAYINYADGMTGPVHYSFSPVNDTMYFAQATLKMYSEFYGIQQPLGNDLPLRAFTHIGELDNAFAIPSIYDGEHLLAHQQIIIGNGSEYLTAPSQSVIGHELSHNFTELNSGLIYDKQSGGINESFSDMAAIALQDYLRKSYPWYWDGKDWSIGREAGMHAEPLRYMDNPTQDGASIDNAQNYTDELDVHFTSGVFNKAFYLLSSQPGWSVRKAFQVMVDANQHYWQPESTYELAACGVLQATKDRGWDKAAVIQAFKGVGVTCPNEI